MIKVPFKCECGNVLVIEDGNYSDPCSECSRIYAGFYNEETGNVEAIEVQEG